MNKYTIAILNKSTGDLLVLMEMHRPRFTKREFDLVIGEMFYWAAKSCEYDHLTAEIICNGEKVITITCKTRQDGSEVYSVITANDKPVRCMTVAA